MPAETRNKKVFVKTEFIFMAMRGVVTEAHGQTPSGLVRIQQVEAWKMEENNFSVSIPGLNQSYDSGINTIAQKLETRIVKSRSRSR